MPTSVRGKFIFRICITSTFKTLIQQELILSSVGMLYLPLSGKLQSYMSFNIPQSSLLKDYLLKGKEIPWLAD